MFWFQLHSDFIFYLTTDSLQEWSIGQLIKTSESIANQPDHQMCIRFLGSFSAGIAIPLTLVILQLWFNSTDVFEQGLRLIKALNVFTEVD